MTNETLAAIAAVLGVSVWVLVLAFIWSAVWKLLALWKSARNGSVAWFIVLAIINTLGILEILYIFVFSEMNRNKTNSEMKTALRQRTAKKTARKR